MSDSSNTLKRELWIVAKYRALIITRYLLLLFLISGTFIVSYFDYALSPLYILLLFSILKYYSPKINWLSPYVKEPEFQLTTVKKKYDYKRIHYLSHFITFHFVLVLLFLWQFNYITLPDMNRWLVLLPGFILLTGVIIRFVGSLYYYFKLDHALSNNSLKL